MTTRAKTVSPVTVSRLPKLNGWHEWVSYAGELRATRDALSFELGDVVLHVCTRKPGRPANESDVHTVAAFAREIGEARSVLSALASNSEFWGREYRTSIPPEVSWRQLARARVSVGWKPGLLVTDALREDALALAIENRGYEVPDASGNESGEHTEEEDTAPSPWPARALAVLSQLRDILADAPGFIRPGLLIVIEGLADALEGVRA